MYTTSYSQPLLRVRPQQFSFGTRCVFVGIRDGSGLIYQNWSKCIFTCQPPVKSIFGFAFVVSLVNGLSKKFSLSIYCFLCQYSAKLS